MVMTKEITHKWRSTIDSFISIKSTDNDLGEAGRASFIDVLKSNTTLTQLNLGGKDKRNRDRNGISISLFSILNREQDWRCRKSIIE